MPRKTIPFPEGYCFEGFPLPAPTNSTPIPNQFLDHTLPHTTLAGLKISCAIFRHGEGIVQDIPRLAAITGLSKPAIYAGIHQIRDLGYLSKPPGVPGFIYIVRACNTNLYKIGKTRTTVIHRLDNLRGASPLPLELIWQVAVANIDEVEHFMHTLFGDRRIHHEWFALTPEDISKLEHLP